MSEKLTFTAVDQHRFEANIYPAENTAAPLLVFFSALGTPAKVYRHFGSEMSRNGVHVCAPDWRGIDSSSVRAGRACDFGYRHLVEMDMACVIDVVRHRFPESPLWLGGHSLGGQLSLLCAAANDDQVAGVVTVASGTVHLPCYSPKMRVGIGGLVVI